MKEDCSGDISLGKLVRVKELPEKVSYTVGNISHTCEIANIESVNERERTGGREIEIDRQTEIDIRTERL